MLHERGERHGLGGGLEIPGAELSVLVESRRAIPPSAISTPTASAPSSSRPDGSAACPAASRTVAG